MDRAMIRPIEQSEWGVMREQAKVLIGTGFLPEAIKTAEQAIAIMMKARELGLPPMYGLSNIAIIKGKPGASAELMLALIYRDHGDEAIRFTETNAQTCTIRYKRRNWAQPESYSFTAQDAEAAGLLSNITWKQYRPAMLRARCISAVARMGFPDTIGGLYTPEELGASVSVSEAEEMMIHSPVELEKPPMISPDWPRFWVHIKGLGVDHEEAHKALGVGSVKDWPGSLDEAITAIERYVLARDTVPTPQQGATPSQPVAPTPAAKPRRPLTRDELVAAYRGRCDTADALGVPATTYDPRWTDQQLKDEGLALKEKIQTAEANIPQQAAG